MPNTRNKLLGLTKGPVQSPPEPFIYRCRIHCFKTLDAEEWREHCRLMHPSLEGKSIYPVFIGEAGETGEEEVI